MNIIFLHLPKTAGQSVHAFLERFFRHEEICPARENFQLLPIPLSQLRQYRLFSGHLDWALLDAVGGPRFVFTILREPAERILSFYFFLRQKAATLDANMINLPEYQGLRAAATLSPDEYFCAGPRMLRNFIDTHYDNFYTYYFAGRTVDARAKLIGIMKREHSLLTQVKLTQLALENIKCLDRVYTTQSLDRLQTDIQDKLGRKVGGLVLSKLRINTGNGDLELRMGQLRALGATKSTFDRIHEMTSMDTEIWSAYTQSSV